MANCIPFGLAAVLALGCQDASEPMQVDSFVSFADLEALDPPYTPEDVGEAQEPFAVILVMKAFCTLVGALVTHHLCEHNADKWWQQHCPAHAKKRYIDEWGVQIKTKRGTNPPAWFYQVDFDCDNLRELTCETLAVGGGHGAGLFCESIAL